MLYLQIEEKNPENGEQYMLYNSITQQKFLSYWQLFQHFYMNVHSELIGVIEDIIGVIEDVIGVIEYIIGVIEDIIGVIEDVIGVIEYIIDYTFVLG